MKGHAVQHIGGIEGFLNHASEDGSGTPPLPLPNAPAEQCSGRRRNRGAIEAIRRVKVWEVAALAELVNAEPMHLLTVDRAQPGQSSRRSIDDRDHSPRSAERRQQRLDIGRHRLPGYPCSLGSFQFGMQAPRGRHRKETQPRIILGKQAPRFQRFWRERAHVDDRVRSPGFVQPVRTGVLAEERRAFPSAMSHLRLPLAE